MDRGYIKSWRKGEDSAVFKDPHLWQLWTWCLWRAAWQEKVINQRTGRGSTIVNLKPGQFLFGRKTAAAALGQHESSIRNRMAKLKKLGNVDMQVDTHFSVISIVNWDTYQPADETIGQPTGQAKDRQRTGKGHEEEVKELKKEKKKSKPLARNGSRVVSQAVQKPTDVSDGIWVDFLAVRQRKKAPLTATAWAGILREVEKSGWTTEQALAECCERGWQGFKSDWVEPRQNQQTTERDREARAKKVQAQIQADPFLRAVHEMKRNEEG